MGSESREDPGVPGQAPGVLPSSSRRPPGALGAAVGAASWATAPEEGQVCGQQGHVCAVVLQGEFYPHL